MSINDKLGNIDFDKEPSKPKLYLYRTDYEMIAKLKEAFNIKYNLKLSEINTINFDIPYYIDIHHRLQRNPSIDKIKERYYLKIKNEEIEEWFLITNIIDSMDTNGNFIKRIKAFSKGYELRDKNIRDYNVTSYNAREVLNDVLKNTLWKVGYIDADFELKYRSFEFDKKTVLDCVNEIAETFEALIDWDTKDRIINLYKSENIGRDRGLKFTYGKYLKQAEKENNVDEMVTRLKVFGKDDLSIQRINPTGSNYIEDFSFFIYPFERDEDKKTIKHSDYMTDSLCHAILDYKEKIENKQGEFDDLLSQIETQEEILTTKEDELNKLNNELDIILDNLFVAQTTNQSYGHIETKKQKKEEEIKEKEEEIEETEDTINNIKNDLDELKEEVSVENNFTFEQIQERNKFIIERNFEDKNIDDDKILYERAIEKLDELREPQLNIDFNIINFLEIIEAQRDWHKLNLGDFVNVYHEKLDLNIKARLIEFDFDYENKDINLKIANVTKIKDKDQELIDMIYKSYSTSNTVDMKKNKWDDYDNDLGEVSNVIQNMYDYTKEQIDTAVNETVKINRRGITILDPKDSNTFLRATHGALAITNDGGNTYKHAITGQGIVGERIFGRIIMGEKVVIGDNDGILEIRGNKGVVTDRTGREVMWFGLYDDSDEKFGLKLESDFNQIFIDRDEGFKITRYEDEEWVDKFYVDTNGRLYAEDLIAKRLKIINSKGEEVLSEDSLTMDFEVLEKIFQDNVITSVEKSTLRNEWKNIKSTYSLLIDQIDRYLDTVYTDRTDSTQSYSALKEAKEDLEESEDKLKNRYDELKSALEPVFEDMDVTTHVIDDLGYDNKEQFLDKFENYHESANEARDRLEDLLEASSLQLGRDYNNVVIDAINGVTVTRDDEKVRTILNATDGISIQRDNEGNWVDKFYVDTDGYLWAEDITAKRLTIINNKDEMLLDEESLNFDFTTLESIIVDDIITSNEKVTLYNEWISIQESHNTLLNQIDYYLNDVYNNRENSYDDLDNAKDNLNNAKDNLIENFNDLDDELESVFDNMNKTTHIKDDLNYEDDDDNTAREKFYNLFRDYYDSFNNARDRLENFLEKSSLQLGRNYNKTVIDAENGVTVTRDDEKVRTMLNATDGISIQRDNEGNWEDKFYADTDGTLWAEDLITKRIKLLGDDEDVILDTESRFFDLNKLDDIVGKLTADHISSKSFFAEDGFIANLAVNTLKTIKDDTTGEVDYIDIRENKARWITGEIKETSTQVKDYNNNPLYWTDSSKTSTTTKETDYPVYEYDEDISTKLAIYFDEDSEYDVPIMEFGVGADSGDKAKGFITKYQTGFEFVYYDEYDEYPRKIDFKNDGMDIECLGEDHPINLIVSQQGNVNIKYDDEKHKIATYKSGSSSFDSTSGTSISHDLGHTDYTVNIIPISNPDGYLGEVWIDKKSDSFTVYNSGSFTGEFDYTIIY